jgi:hypothetical protein
VSSFRLAPGWRATVYEQRDYKGESYMATEDTVIFNWCAAPARTTD